jgi:hypothetical protein
MGLLTEAGKRCAYTAIEHGHSPSGEPFFFVAVCVEGDNGYRPLISNYGLGPRGRIDGIVGRLNARIGVDEADAKAIVASTFKRSTRSRKAAGR